MANANNSSSIISSNSDDAESMRLAFEQFMLSGGKNKNNNNNNNNQSEKSNDEASSSSVATPPSISSKSKKKKKKKRSSTGAATPKVVATTPPTSATKQLSSQSPAAQRSTSSSSSSSLNPKIKKRYYQLLRSFNDKVKHTWMDIDEQILSVLQNIVSIRGRLSPEWKLLSQATRYQPVEESPEQDDETCDDIDNQDDWKSHGHQESSKASSSQQYFSHLRIEDIQLALSHDLEQHEKMLTGLRSLMSNMAECHDALGRLVDSLWQFHLECSEEDCNDKNEGTDCEMEHIVNCVTSSYQMLSMELYKKQNIIPTVIDSTKDDILGISELGRGHFGVGTKSQKLVRGCCESWKRSPSDDELLLNAMKLGELT